MALEQTEATKCILAAEREREQLSGIGANVHIIDCQRLLLALFCSKIQYSAEARAFHKDSRAVNSKRSDCMILILLSFVIDWPAIKMALKQARAKAKAKAKASFQKGS